MTPEDYGAVRGHRVAEHVQRLLALLRRRPFVADGGLVVLLLLPTLASRLGELETTPAARAFSIALILPLLARRRWPVPVLALIATIAAAQWLADVRAYGDVALLVALYSVAVVASTRTTLLAYAVVEAGAALAAARWGDPSGPPLDQLVGLTGLATAATVMGTNTRSRRVLVASLEERAERLEHERDQQAQLATAAERSRIAREMHDIVAHNLSVMIALADGAGYAMHDDPDRAENAMQTASRTGRQALTEMRRLLGVLRQEDADAGELAPQPGLAQLDALVEQVRATGLPLSYEAVGTPTASVTPGLQLAVYRIVQEALTNTLKHAGPGASAHLELRHRADALELDVVDTGGTVPVVGTSGRGAGLRGMRERAAVYDGEITAGPQPQGGWGVHLVVPLSRPLVPA